MIERYSDHRRMSGRFSPGCAPRSPSWRSVFWSRSSTCSCGSQPDPSCAILVGGQSDCRQHFRTVADCTRWRGDGFCRDSPPQDYARHRCQRGPAGPGGAARYYTRRAPPLAGGHLIRLSDIHGHQLALTSARRSNRNSGFDAALPLPSFFDRNSASADWCIWSPPAFKVRACGKCRGGRMLEDKAHNLITELGGLLPLIVSNTLNALGAVLILLVGLWLSGRADLLV